jgi:ABC-type transport system involved in multi-copper enzyme maturation permease subunit
MTLFPVLVREMNVLSRRKGIYRARTFMAFAGLLAFGWAVLLSASQFSFAALGKSIFVTLSSLAFGYALLVGVHATSDCISEEKREGTLGLLFLTDLKGYDVVLGKLAASSLSAAFALFAIVPMISLGLLVGGITLLEIGMVTVCIANGLFFSLALGVFISVLSKNERRAMVASAVTLFLFSAGPFMLAAALSDFQKFPARLIAASPVYPILYVLAPPIPGWTGLQSNYAWTCVAAYFGLAWLLLICACVIVPKLVNDLPVRSFARLRRAFHDYTYGSKQQRARRRGKLLDRNAFLWLAARERLKPAGTWALLGFFVLLHLWVYFWFPQMFFDFAISGTIILMLHTTLKVWAASEICNRLIEDRRSGALELLLSTPLGEREIVAGQNLALRRIFQWPLTLLCVAELAMAGAALHSNLLNPSAAERAATYLAFCSTLLLDIWALKWVGMWLSMRGTSIERVLISTVARVLSLPTLIYAGVMTLISVGGQLIGKPVSGWEYLVCWFVIGVVNSLVFGFRARANFLSQFREMASGRFDSTIEEERPAKPIAAAGVPILRKPKKRPLRWALGSVLVLFVIAVICASVRRIYWGRRVWREVQQIHAKNLPASRVEILVFFPPVLAGQNGSFVLGTAGFVTRNSPGFYEWRRFRDHPGPRRRISAEAHTAFASCLQSNGSQLRAFHDAAACSGFHSDATAGYGIDLEGFLAVASMDILMGSAKPESNWDAGAQRVESGVLGMLRFARLLAPEQEFYSNFTLSCLLRAIQPALINHQLSEPALAKIAVQVNSLASLDCASNSIVVTRANVLSESRARPQPGTLQSRVAGVMIGLLSFTGSIDRQVCRLLDILNAGLHTASMPPWERLKQWDGSQPETTPVTSPEEACRRMVLRAFRTSSGIQAHVQLLRTAVAAARFFNVHQRYPKSIEEMVPAFLNSVPIDPFSGEPLKCKSLADSSLPEQSPFTIYSIGDNLIDDGGVEQQNGPSDIVFAF